MDFLSEGNPLYILWFFIVWLYLYSPFKTRRSGYNSISPPFIWHSIQRTVFPGFLVTSWVGAEAERAEKLLSIFFPLMRRPQLSLLLLLVQLRYKSSVGSRHISVAAFFRYYTSYNTEACNHVTKSVENFR